MVRNSPQIHFAISGVRRHPPVRWDRRTMSQSRHQTSLGVTGCRKEIPKDRDKGQCRKNVARFRKNVARMSRDFARMSRCRGVPRKIVRVHTKRQQSRRLRSTLRHNDNRIGIRIPTDWGVIAKIANTAVGYRPIGASSPCKSPARGRGQSNQPRPSPPTLIAYTLNSSLLSNP